MRVTFEVRALRGHQRKSLCFGGFEAKYAATFPRKARSLSRPVTWLRTRTSSARSAELSSSPLVPSRVSMRRRSSRGVDDAMRCLGSELQRELPSGCSHGDILPVGPRAGLSGVHFRWEPHISAVWAWSVSRSAGNEVRSPGVVLGRVGLARLPLLSHPPDNPVPEPSFLCSLMCPAPADRSLPRF